MHTLRVNKPSHLPATVINVTICPHVKQRSFSQLTTHLSLPRYFLRSDEPSRGKCVRKCRAGGRGLLEVCVTLVAANVAWNCYHQAEMRCGLQRWAKLTSLYLDTPRFLNIQSCRLLRTQLTLQLLLLPQTFIHMCNINTTCKQAFMCKTIGSLIMCASLRFIKVVWERTVVPLIPVAGWVHKAFGRSEAIIFEFIWMYVRF